MKKKSKTNNFPNTKKAEKSHVPVEYLLLLIILLLKATIFLMRKPQSGNNTKDNQNILNSYSDQFLLNLGAVNDMEKTIPVILVS